MSVSITDTLVPVSLPVLQHKRQDCLNLIGAPFCSGSHSKLAAFVLPGKWVRVVFQSVNYGSSRS